MMWWIWKCAEFGYSFYALAFSQSDAMDQADARGFTKLRRVGAMVGEKEDAWNGKPNSLLVPEP